MAPFILTVINSGLRRLLLISIASVTLPTPMRQRRLPTRQRQCPLCTACKLTCGPGRNLEDWMVLLLDSLDCKINLGVHLLG